MNAVTPRVARADDLEAISRIEAASFPEDPWTRSMLAETLANADSPVFVVEDAAAGAVGFAAVLAARGAGEADVLTIAVDPDARGRGVGRTLLRRLARAARDRGAHLLFLEVRAGNAPARALYESEGFAEIGVRPHYYRPDGEDAVVMRLDLHRWERELGGDAAANTAVRARYVDVAGAPDRHPVASRHGAGMADAADWSGRDGAPAPQARGGAADGDAH